MKTIELQRQIQKLEALMTTAAAASAGNAELLGHWARYFSVLAAGLLENAIPILYGSYVEKCSSTLVANYAVSRLETIQNPKGERFVQLARSFNPSWGDELEGFLGDGGRKDAIDSIMNTRHHVAHGKDTGISMVRIREYIKSATEVLEFIESQLGL